MRIISPRREGTSMQQSSCKACSGFRRVGALRRCGGNSQGCNFSWSASWCAPTCLPLGPSMCCELSLSLSLCVSLCLFLSLGLSWTLSISLFHTHLAHISLSLSPTSLYISLSHLSLSLSLCFSFLDDGLVWLCIHCCVERSLQQSGV